ncbi:MAG: hypothetical protein Q9188_004815 [Gyalolechia gomerana]
MVLIHLYFSSHTSTYGGPDTMADHPLMILKEEVLHAYDETNAVLVSIIESTRDSVTRLKEAVQTTPFEQHATKTIFVLQYFGGTCKDAHDMLLYLLRKLQTRLGEVMEDSSAGLVVYTLYAIAILLLFNFVRMLAVSVRDLLKTALLIVLLPVWVLRTLARVILGLLRG